jgi:hypothetical protein
LIPVLRAIREPAEHRARRGVGALPPRPLRSASESRIVSIRAMSGPRKRVGLTRDGRVSAASHEGPRPPSAGLRRQTRVRDRLSTSFGKLSKRTHVALRVLFHVKPRHVLRCPAGGGVVRLGLAVEPARPRSDGSVYRPISRRAFIHRRNGERIELRAPRLVRLRVDGLPAFGPRSCWSWRRPGPGGGGRLRSTGRRM